MCRLRTQALVMMRSSIKKPDPGIATTQEIEVYLGVKGDKRRELFLIWGVLNHRKVLWSEIWSSIGLDAIQYEDLWQDLKMPLWNSKEVTELTGISVRTINLWYKKEKYPEHFPHSIRLGVRKKAWIPLEVLTYKQPTVYSKKAQRIRRPVGVACQTKSLAPILRIDLSPLGGEQKIKKNVSSSGRSANLPIAAKIERAAMIATIEKLVSEISSKEEALTSLNMDAVIDMLQVVNCPEFVGDHQLK